MASEENNHHHPAFSTLLLGNRVPAMLKKMANTLVTEVFPCLSSKEAFWESVHTAWQNVLNNPCTAIFYTSIMLFGIIPILCFILAIACFLFLGIVWFLLTQVTLFFLAACGLGVFMVMIITSSFFIASSFGVAIHIIYSWTWIKAHLSDNWRDILFYILSYGGRPGLWAIRQLEFEARHPAGHGDSTQKDD